LVACVVAVHCGGEGGSTLDTIMKGGHTLDALMNGTLLGPVMSGPAACGYVTILPGDKSTPPSAGTASRSSCNSKIRQQAASSSDTKREQPTKQKPNVELIYCLAYTSFAVTMAVAMVLTKSLSGLTQEDLDNSLLKQHFGYNTLCIYLGFPPAIYVAPAFWAASLVLWTLATVFTYFRSYDHFKAGEMTELAHKVVRTCSVLEILGYIFFATCFAAQPSSEFELKVHTLPFTGFLVATAIHGISQTVVGTTSGYWHSLGLSRPLVQMAICWVVINCLVCGYKVAFQIRHLFFTWPPTQAEAFVGHLADQAFSLLYVAPYAWNVHLAACRYLDVCNKLGSGPMASDGRQPAADCEALEETATREETYWSVPDECFAQRAASLAATSGQRVAC